MWRARLAILPDALQHLVYHLFMPAPPQAGMTHNALYACFTVQSTQDTVENLNHAKADLEKTVTRWVIDID